MTSVGIRELRGSASELLRLVQQGETIEITDRGRPVAHLAPVPEGGPYEQLLAAGAIEVATSSIDLTYVERMRVAAGALGSRTASPS